MTHTYAQCPSDGRECTTSSNCAAVGCARKRASGFDLARSLGPENAAAADALQAMMPQVFLALVKRAGGSLTVPVAEIDDTGGWLLSLEFDQCEKTFTFVASRKS